MNRIVLVGAAAVAALSLAACNKASNTADNASNTTASAVNGTENAIDKTQDATGAAVGSMSAATLGSHDTGAFVSNVGQSDMYEIQAAKIAQDKSKNADVKKFAAEMIKDHTKLMNEMKPIAIKAGQTPPTDLDQRRQGFLDNLKAADAGAFDKTYMDQQVAAHDEALTLLQGYAKDGGDAGLKAAAAKAVPIVQHHSDMAKQIQAKVAASTK